MKLYTLFTLSMVIFIGLCQAITCEEAKAILGVEYEGNCCELQQINCDESQETILSIESLEDYDYDDSDNTLYRRKGGGGHGGGHSSGGHSSSSSHSSSSGSSGVYVGGHSHGYSSSGVLSVFKPSYGWMIVSAILLFVFNH